MRRNSFKYTVLRNLSNIKGWRSKHKIVVIESDDWGSIRMSSKEAFERLQRQGLNLTGGDSTRYNRYDTMESADDLQALFQTLQAVKDAAGNYPVFTALSLVANPDFDAIRANRFQQYQYELFTTTLNKYQRDGAYNMYKQGINNKLFIPQFHGREHLNVAVWMRALQRQEPQTLAAFEEGIWGFKNTNSNRINYQAAFELEHTEDLLVQKEIVKDGLRLFESVFGYKASFFVPPNGPINNALEPVAGEAGVRYISSAKRQLESLGNGQVRKVYHHLGQRNNHGQLYLTRNCFFEPSMQGKDWVASCLNDINIAFRWKKPAVISTHRVNFTGSLDEANRTHGLQQLKLLLLAIKQQWPEVLFMSSNQLGDLIIKGNLS